MAKMPAATKKQARSTARKTPRSAKEPRKPEFLAEKAYRELRNSIMTGEFLPGTRLREEILVKRFGVSRTVIRQALTHLAADGLVQDEPGRGKTVIEHSAEALAQLLPIRIALEQLALRLAMQQMSDEDLVELKAMAARLRDPDLDLAEQDRLDVGLHQFLWAKAGNTPLEEILQRVTGPFHLTSHAAMLSSIGRRASAAVSWQHILLEQERHAGGHQLLTEAIVRGDTAAAVRAMEKHLTFNYESSPDEYNRKVAQLIRQSWPRDVD